MGMMALVSSTGGVGSTWMVVLSEPGTGAEWLSLTLSAIVMSGIGVLILPDKTDR
jgi:hypothetical protein